MIMITHIIKITFLTLWFIFNRIKWFIDVVAKNPNYNGMLYEEKGRRILSHTGEKVIVDEQGRGWVIEKMPVKEFKADQWHDFRILVEGNHHQHWIDGHKTADLIDFDEAGRALEGVLAVQVHVGPAMKIQYKDSQGQIFSQLPTEGQLQEVIILLGMVRDQVVISL